MFRDRTDAGERLAETLRERGVTADVVLAVPRGGLPVGRVVADALGRPLDVVVARKLGAPGNPELAIGAVGADGATWLNDDLLDRLGVGEGYVERERERQTAVAREKREAYQPEPVDLAGKSVLIVDDGIATGATTIACVRAVEAAGARRVVVAVPVAPPESVALLRQVADDVVCVETPFVFGAVARFYDSFPQVSDDEARAYLDRGRVDPAAP
ncbi:phosphoribosyltransferase [Halomarina litorea]|uniref:phosphoribosyltransferase n=1 Tax=Halomarina litorea TaxID=2961595 RepID=UPI0020C4C995|nr:phosphoribosyltransferase family protein [Halomarina sp. BCD28]